MIDTFKFNLKRENSNVSNWVKHFENIADIKQETNFKKNNLTSRVGILKSGHTININDNSLTFNGSLSTYYLGTNLINLTPIDVRNAINKLSSELEMDISKAKVNKMDIGLNIETNYNSKAYFPFLFYKDRCEKGIIDNTIYFKNKSIKIKIYDKIEEQKNNKNFIKESYDNNITRIENSISGSSSILDNKLCLIENLYEKESLKYLIKILKKDYQEIKKIYYNSYNLNLQKPKDIKDYYVASHIKNVGIDYINNDLDILKKKNNFSKKSSFYRAKKYVKEIAEKYKNSKYSTIISELDEKFYDYVSEYELKIDELSDDY